MVLECLFLIANKLRSEISFYLCFSQLNIEFHLTNSTPQRPTFLAILIYAMGQFGWSLASFGALNLLVYFYMPPENGEISFPTFINQGAIFGFFTVIGIITFGGRIFDAITDPLIANWSDKLTNNFGKRKSMMAISAIPFSLLSFLIFYPITSDISLNTGWLLVMIFLFFLSMTVYVVPYTALISELGHHPDDRLKISTFISITFALGLMVGNMAHSSATIFSGMESNTHSFQACIGVFAIVSLVFMLIPVFFLDEKKYAQQEVASYDLGKAIKSVFSNVNFRYFMFSDFMYWLALTFIQVGIVYYVTLLFGKDTSAGTLFMTIAFLTSFIIYVPISILAKKIGKKKVLMIAFLFFSVVFALTFLTPILPISTDAMFYILAAGSGFPLAAFGIIPNAIIADIIHEHAATTGVQQPGMFYAVRNFMMKLGASLATLIFPSLLLLGKSTENPMGVKVSAILAVVFCLIGFFIFTRYKERIPV